MSKTDQSVVFGVVFNMSCVPTLVKVSQHLILLNTLQVQK